jgi:hypothetical protein
MADNSYFYPYGKDDIIVGVFCEKNAYLVLHLKHNFPLLWTGPMLYYRAKWQPYRA